jgi:hypothetical protein
VHPLEPPGQQHQLVHSNHVKPLIWHSHQRGQGEHPGGWVRVRLSFRATDEGETMRVSQALNLGFMPRSTSADLSFENSLFTVKVSYFFDSIMASNFPPQTVRSKEC